MKKLFGLVALLALSFVLSARAARVNVVECELGNFAVSTWTKDFDSKFNAFLSDNAIDFGYFAGAKSTDYFKLNFSGYDCRKKGLISNNVSSRTYFVFNTDKYELVDLGDGESCDYVIGGGSNTFIAYLVRNKESGIEYLCIHLAGIKYDLTKGVLTEANYVGFKTLKDRCLEAHENARLIVFHPGSATYAKTYANILTYLNGSDYMGLTCLASETTAGGLHADTNYSISVNYSLHDKLWDDATAEYPLVATLTYPHVVKFVDDDMTEIQTSLVNDGDPAVAPADPVKSGFDFVGWNPSDFSAVTDDMTIVAQYQAAAGSAIVTFKDEDETVVETKSVKTGETVSPPDNPPTKVGHSLSGWLKNGEPYDFSVPVAESFDLIASYTANVYAVTFRYEDGEVIDRQYVEYQNPAVAPANPAPHAVGELFYGWNPADFSCIEADADIVAVFGPPVREVATVEDFVAAMANLPAPATVKLVEDLDFSEVKGYVSPTLVGTLDGNGHTVSGLSGNVALVNVVRGGTIRNLKVANFSRACTDHDQEGGLVANRVEGGVIENVEVADSTFTAKNSNCNLASIAYIVTSNGMEVASVVSNCVVRNCRLSAISACGLGGVVGYVGGDSEVVDCRFLVDDKTTEALGGSVTFAGGIAMGVSGGRVTRCCAEGRIKVSGAGNAGGNTGAGGIVGVSSSNGKTSWIVDCTNMTDLVATSQSHAAGGIMGRVMKATIRVCGCVNYGSVKVSGDEDDQMGSGCAVGGIVGGGWGTSPSVNIYVSDSKNLGAVTSEDVRPAGGIVGSAVGVDGGISYLRLTNCVNVAAVASHGGFVGGLVGYARHVPSDVLSVVNCGNAGSATSLSNVVGGIFGKIIGQGQNNTKTFVYNGIANVMNCGVLSTDSGVIGQFVGDIEAEPYGAGGVYQNIHRFDLQRFFCLDRADTDLAGRVIGKEGTGVTIDETSVTNLAASAFTDRKVVKKLNVYADANDLPLWVQTKDCPDLSLFSKGINFGMVLLVR